MQQHMQFQDNTSKNFMPLRHKQGEKFLILAPLALVP